MQALTTAMALLVPRPDDAAFLASNTVDRKAQASATMSGADLLRLTEDAQADEAVEENGDEEDEEEGEEDGEGPAAAELAANRAENAATNGSAAAAAAASAAPAVSISSTMTIVEDEGNAPVVSQLLENGRLLRNK